MNGTCKLCKNPSALEKSHFIPKFIGKWLKKTSITGYIREKNEVHKRAQDLAKEYWLCGKCEDLFSDWEREFSLKIFYPFINDSTTRMPYGNWLSKFAASLSWRTLTFIRSKNLKDETSKSKDYLKNLDGAELALANYLLGKTDNLFQYEQHIYPVEAIDTHNVDNLPRNINRYFLRNIAMDIIGNDSETYIYTKLPSFIILGVIKTNASKIIRSSRISIKGDVLKPRDYTFPDGIAEYIFEKAEEISKIYDEIPVKQLEKINKFISDNPDKVIESKLFQAIQHDYDQFGSEAFKKEN
ncbi:hypothetical protein ACQKC7_10160 [Pseudoalteromonas tetraodonis]|uniref:HNH endonuclease n=1 Tax=Pseudoalteromonas tetraodonis GFC TaxID=1315271 RepID=A0AA37S152_9GAMM|nr:hypothetical protein [Pseudoalteromonas tetraodonis]ATD02142.1 hypothetical protein PTET_a0600 [Pseudoalteromonas tetraodonis]GEN38753.1 hypothetical protein PTE01_18630 [Pseudoalteromonas tetraodonis GFC]GLQ02068.1 hypothetical protein GCM10007914_09490 [Pseudoalteromonas tetraodonis GFC]